MKLFKRGTQSHKALLVLGLAGGVLDRRDLLRRSDLTKAALSEALKVLAHKGLIVERQIEPTEKGREALETFAIWSQRREPRQAEPTGGTP